MQMRKEHDKSTLMTPMLNWTNSNWADYLSNNVVPMLYHCLNYWSCTDVLVSRKRFLLSAGAVKLQKKERWDRSLQNIDHPNLKLSLDTGHAHLVHCNYRAPPVVDFITAAGENLTHVHLQDVDGYADRHWHPGEGSIPWQAVMDELRKSPSKPHLIIEVRKNMHRLPATAEFLEHLAVK